MTNQFLYNIRSSSVDAGVRVLSEVKDLWHVGKLHFTEVALSTSVTVSSLETLESDGYPSLGLLGSQRSRTRKKETSVARIVLLLEPDLVEKGLVRRDLHSRPRVETRSGPKLVPDVSHSLFVEPHLYKLFDLALPKVYQRIKNKVYDLVREWFLQKFKTTGGKLVLSLCYKSFVTTLTNCS